MRNIAFLSSQDTLPGAQNRRVDAFEHDQTVAALQPAFLDWEMALCPVAWDDPTIDWSTFTAAIVGTAWDYQDRKSEFLDTLERIEAQTRLYNSVAMIRWNIHKIYLQELAAKGVPGIPTLWLDQASDSVFDELKSNDLVFKGQVAAGALGQYRLKKGEVIPPMSKPMMVQPFLPMINTEGELSFIYIEGQLSHALIKRPIENDYRVQSIYGGFEESVIPSLEDKAAAAQVLNALKEIPLYVRVDMIRGENKELLLMEVEMIEPFLYPEQGPELGPRLAAAFAGKIA